MPTNRHVKSSRQDKKLSSASEKWFSTDNPCKPLCKHASFRKVGETVSFVAPLWLWVCSLAHCSRLCRSLRDGPLFSPQTEAGGRYLIPALPALISPFEKADRNPANSPPIHTTPAPALFSAGGLFKYPDHPVWMFLWKGCRRKFKEDLWDER